MRPPGGVVRRSNSLDELCCPPVECGYAQRLVSARWLRRTLTGRGPGLSNLFQALAVTDRRRPSGTTQYQKANPGLDTRYSRRLAPADEPRAGEAQSSFHALAKQPNSSLPKFPAADPNLALDSHRHEQGEDAHRQQPNPDAE